MCMEKYIQQIRFHLPLFALTLFHTSQKPPQVSVIFFLRIKGFLFEIWHKNEEMESACEDVTADL